MLRKEELCGRQNKVMMMKKRRRVEKIKKTLLMKERNYGRQKKVMLVKKGAEMKRGESLADEGKELNGRR